MSQTHFLFVVSALVGALYFAKNIKINISGAEALPQLAQTAEMLVSRPAKPNSSSQSQEDSVQFLKSKKVDEEKAQGSLNHLVGLIQDQKLCEFLSYTHSNTVSTLDQYRALSLSFSNPAVVELDVFLNPSMGRLESYKSEAARAFIVATDQGAFESTQSSKSKDFSQGLTEKHKDFLDLHDKVFSQFKKNLFYPLMKNNIYVQYKNLPEKKRQEIFDTVMATTHYRNPIFDMVRSIYLQSINNVAQFYLASDIFNKFPIAVDRLYLQKSIWAVYAPDMRDHYADVLLANLERNQDSSKMFGYEPDVFFAYRNSVPYSLYETLPDPSDFDKTRVQPVYELKDLKLDLESGCTPEKVQELAIKLRSL